MPDCGNVNRAGFSSPATGDTPKLVKYELRLETSLTGQ